MHVYMYIHQLLSNQVSKQAANMCVLPRISLDPSVRTSFSSALLVCLQFNYQNHFHFHFLVSVSSSVYADLRPNSNSLSVLPYKHPRFDSGLRASISSKSLFSISSDSPFSPSLSFTHHTFAKRKLEKSPRPLHVDKTDKVLEIIEGTRAMAMAM